MSRLYDLIPAYAGVMTEMENCIGDPERMAMLMDTLESIEMAVEVKADGYCKMIAMLDDTAGIEAESKRLAERARAQRNAAAGLKQRLQQAMEAMGRDKIKTDLFTVAIQNNPPALSVTDEMAIPTQYMVLIPEHYTVDKAKVKDALKYGQAVPGAELTQGRSLRIR